jgi:GTP cyclohydrolase I
MEVINSDSQIIKTSLSSREKQILLYQAQDFIKFFGDGSPGQKDTPIRMVKAWEELLTCPEPNITVFDANGYDEMIVDKGIPFFTFCEHHVLPFHGTVKIGYIPNNKIIGLSKLARIVQYFSKRLNTQEYLTLNIANYLEERLSPKGVGVIIKAVHLCKLMRGIKSPGEMITSKLTGVFLEKQAARQEFISL